MSSFSLEDITKERTVPRRPTSQPALHGSLLVVGEQEAKKPKPKKREGGYWQCKVLGKNRHSLIRGIAVRFIIIRLTAQVHGC